MRIYHVPTEELPDTIAKGRNRTISSECDGANPSKPKKAVTMSDADPPDIHPHSNPRPIGATILSASIGAYVRDRRIAHKMTQRQLAELAGVGVRFLSELERDKATLRMDAVNAVLAVFGKRLGVVDRERHDGNESTS
jgi:y4mF family transcriptional regulator